MTDSATNRQPDRNCQRAVVRAVAARWAAATYRQVPHFSMGGNQPSCGCKH